uniref:Uncharacterized protein n=1 Tax=Mycena chlorophos TaxID=658473 RepID=A0ABQ0L8X9_MYCCL|nr:predicted protein [Mycena chlorophos]
MAATTVLEEAFLRMTLLCAVDCGVDGLGSGWLQLQAYKEFPALAQALADLAAGNNSTIYAASGAQEFVCGGAPVNRIGLADLLCGHGGIRAFADVWAPLSLRIWLEDPPAPLLVIGNLRDPVPTKLPTSSSLALACSHTTSAGIHPSSFPRPPSMTTSACISVSGRYRRQARIASQMCSFSVPMQVWWRRLARALSRPTFHAAAPSLAGVCGRPSGRDRRQLQPKESCQLARLARRYCQSEEWE